jgi:tRNA pseudouridine38-40 synthase
MNNIVLHLAYQGTHYLGFQKTIEGSSIQSSLEEALIKSKLSFSPIQAASRTDAGVHAKGQVVNFKNSYNPYPIEKIPIVLNQSLPHDIRVISAELKEPSFHATLNAKSKEYQYNIRISKVELPFDSHLSWHCPHLLDLSLIEKATYHFIGTKNFTSFVNQGSDRQGPCISSIESIQLMMGKDEILRFYVRGSHFHYKMVRNIIGTLIYIGRGKIHVNKLESIFSSLDRRLAGMTAPAHGLVLNHVDY